MSFNTCYTDTGLWLVSSPARLSSHVTCMLFFSPLLFCVLIVLRGIYLVMDRMTIDDMFFNLQNEWSVCVEVY